MFDGSSIEVMGGDGFGCLFDGLAMRAVVRFVLMRLVEGATRTDVSLCDWLTMSHCMSHVHRGTSVTTDLERRLSASGLARRAGPPPAIARCIDTRTESRETML